MNGSSDLLLSNSATCANAAARQDDAHSRALTSNGGQRGPAQTGDVAVWRPYWEELETMGFSFFDC